jgi:hypothetical protein
VDAEGHAVEIKSHPKRTAHYSNPQRDLEYWAQCALSGTQTIVTGTFTSPHGPKGSSVIFNTDEIIYQTLEEFSAHIPMAEKSRSFRYLQSILQEIKVADLVVGVVYEITMDGHEGPLIIRECNPNECAFQINAEVLGNCAEACLRLARDKASVAQSIVSSDPGIRV